MEWLSGIILGILQGLTEFLPVSSSGHLLLAEKLGLGAPSIALNLFLHLSTLAAVILMYRRQFYELIRHPFSKKMLMFIVASIPTAAVALILKNYCYGWLTGEYLPASFMFTAFILAVADIKRNDRISILNNKNALLTGIMQGIAVLPGVSRSGSTVAALTLLGVPKKDAKEFSFMLSVPVILGGAASELTGGNIDFSLSPGPLTVAVVIAFLSGLLSIKLTAKAIDRGSFLPFVVYLVLISAASFLLLY